MFAITIPTLVGKRVGPLLFTTKRHMSHLHLLPTTESAIKARRILNDPNLNPLVNTVTIRASLEGQRDPHAFWDAPEWMRDDFSDVEHGIEDTGILSTTFKSMLNDIGKFTSLERVELHHDHEVEGPSSLDKSGNHKEWTEELREPFLRAVLGALNHPDHPATKLRCLSIRNLQDLTNVEIAESNDFKAVLSRLDSLELSIATEDYDAAPEHEIEISERHSFFSRDLLKYWLEPVQDRLVHLKLYSRCYWGYIPRCDLRTLHFPKLKSLALGNMTFTHDWQVDWIISHGKTLDSLSLDDCPIVHAAMLGQTLDHDRYPILHTDYSLTWDGIESTWAYEARWHDYFRRLRDGLPNLRRFGVGHGPWNLSFGHDTCSAAFDAAALLPAELHAARYCIFHWGTGPTPWIEPRESDRTGRDVHEPYDTCWDEENDIPPPSNPNCRVEDQKALDEFMAVVNGRALAHDSISSVLPRESQSCR